MCQPAFAQSTAKTTAPDWQAELMERYAIRHRQTLRLAARHGWPLSQDYSRHRQLRLQDVDALGQPVYYTLHNAEAAQGTRTQMLYTGGTLGLALSGNSATMAGKLAMWDGGKVLTTHQELKGLLVNSSRTSQKDNATQLSDHATHLAGTLVARGTKVAARGMAFGAQLSVWDYTDDLAELTTAAPGLLISNHAYGPIAGWVYNPSRPGTDPNQQWEWWGTPSISATEDYLFGFYTTKARDLDRIAYNNPFFLMVRSADNKRTENGPPGGTAYFLRNTQTKSTLARSRNDGYDVIPAEATAKNVLTVGAATIRMDAQRQLASLESAPFSGWGPTDDGRIKPDLLGIGTDVLSTLSSSDTAYGTYTGTSMASANVSGSLFLLQELYTQQRTSSTTSSTGSFMRSATLRGLALHTADRFNPANGPDYRQGWGLLNTEAAARVIINQDLAHQILERSLISGSTFTYRLVAQGREPLVATLCWTDPEGTASSVDAASLNSRTPKLINDLDLRLSDDRSTNMPFMLDPAHPERPAIRADNSIDNVEQVYIANPVPGQAYLLSVSHKGRMTYASQPFSVVVSGLRRTTCNLLADVAAVDTTLCAGSALVLNAADKSLFGYQWLRNGLNITDADEASLRVSLPGQYTLRVSDGTGCSVVSKPVKVAVRTLLATIKPASGQWQCTTGQPVSLTAGITAGARFSWLRDGVIIDSSQAALISVTIPGRYQVRVKQSGCEVLSNETIVRPTTVDKLLVLPEETELLLISGATVTLKASIDSTYRYQWYRNGQSIINATEPRLSVAQSGIYKVEVRQQNCVGYSTDRSVQLAILTALTPGPDITLFVFPNPAESILSVRYSSLTANYIQVNILDGRGVLVQRSPLLKPMGGRFDSEIPLVGLPPGHYVLQLDDGVQTYTRRFVKK